MTRISVLTAALGLEAEAPAAATLPEVEAPATLGLEVEAPAAAALAEVVAGN
ncbi:hypothetical protein GGH13_002958 [Coemansia sp. S155-1]|nr:hypothetical protein GGH13_002958 [Coemansia sp. S155-1]